MQTYADWYRDQQGNAIAGGQVAVFIANTSTPATIYEPVASGIPTVAKSNPFTTDANGYFQFAAANGSYSIQLSGNGSSTQVIPYIYLGDLSTSSTGGSGAAGSANQIQYNVGGGIFGASANFTFNPSTNTLTVSGPASLGATSIVGNLSVTGSATTTSDVFVNGTNTPKVRISGNAGQQRQLRYETGGLVRWVFYCNQNAEAGANAGSNFTVEAYADDGATLIDNPISITRASAGAIALGGSSARPVTFSGRINLASIAATTNNGDIFQDSTQKYIGTFVDGVKQGISTALFTQTADGTAANTVAETTISSTGVGTLTLPANFLVAGKTLRIRANGTVGITATPTLTIKLKYGSSIIGQTSAISVVAGVWSVDFNITLRTAGASGTYVCGGKFGNIPTGSWENAYAITASAANIDTTTSNALTLTATWSAASASNTVTCNILTLEVLN